MPKTDHWLASDETRQRFLKYVTKTGLSKKQVFKLFKDIDDSLSPPQTPKVRKERTGWRDAALSAKHREWGWDCPAIDIDFLMIEYDQGMPVALVEYKHERAQQANLGHPSYRAIIHLSNRANLPVFMVRYGDHLDWWTVVPLNDLASDALFQAIAATEYTFDEKDYVAFLYDMRGRIPPGKLETQS